MRLRKPGKKNADYITKSLILLQIADKPGIGMDKLWEYMNAREPGRNMQYKSLLYKHLTQLENWKGIRLITRTRQGHNKPDTFEIAIGFHVFEAVFNFLDDNKYRKQLTTTPYYRKYTEINDFMEKYPLYRLGKNIRQIEGYLQAPDTKTGEQSAHDYRERLLKIFIVNESDKTLFAQEFKALSNNLERHTVDELFPIVKAKIVERAPKGWIIEPRGHLIFLALHLTKDAETHPIQNMLHDSPNVMSFLLNSNYYDPIMMHNLLIRLTCLQGIDEKELKKAMEYGATDEKTRHYDLLELVYRYQNQEDTEETALFQVLKGLAICTQATGRTIKT